MDAVLNRRQDPNVIVLITRGKPQNIEYTMNEVGMLKSRNIRIIAVGVGLHPRHMETYLKEVAAPEDVFLSKYGQLKKHVEDVLGRICLELPVVSKPGRKYCHNLKSCVTVLCHIHTIQQIWLF